MTENAMTPDEEYNFYAQPENQAPQGPPHRRRTRLTAPIPVRFPPELLEEIRRRAGEDEPLSIVVDPAGSRTRAAVPCLTPQRKSSDATGLAALAPSEVQAKDAVPFRKVIAARKKVAEAERELCDTFQAARHPMSIDVTEACVMSRSAEAMD